MKRLLLTAILFLLTIMSTNTLAVTLYPSTETLSDISPGETKTFTLVIIYDNETIDLSSNLGWVSFTQTHYSWNDSSSISVNYTIAVPATATGGIQTFTITADSDRTDSTATRTFNILTELGLLVTYEGYLCPEHSIFFRVADRQTGQGVSGTIIVFDSRGAIIGAGPMDIIRGYSSIIAIPSGEALGITVRAEATGYDTTSKTFPILATCSPPSEARGTKLYVLLPVTNYTISDTKIEVTPMVKTNYSTIKDANCIYSGVVQGMVSSVAGGFCTIEFTQEGVYDVWAEKDGYIPADPTKVNIERVVVEETSPEKTQLTLALLVNGYSVYERINQDDAIVLRLLNSDGQIYPLTGQATILSPTNKQFYVPMHAGLSDSFTPGETGSFSYSIAETNETQGITGRFTATGFEFNPIWAWIIIGIFIMIIAGWLITRRKKSGLPRFRPPAEEPEFLEKIKER